MPADLLPRANGNQQVVLTIGETFVGPPLGSALFAVRAALPFGLDAVSFAGSAALLAGLPRTAKSRTTQPRSEQRMRAQIAEGVRWLAGHRLLRTVALLLGVSNFSSQMGQATLVLLATQTLHVGTGGYGLLWTAAAIGSVLGGLVNPAITRRLGLLTSLIVAMAAFAALDAGIGLAPDFAVAAALMACNGFFVTMWNVVTVTMRQRIVPAELLGRVNSVYRMLGWGLMPLGALAGGFIA
ncbi:MAG: MFS transporter, partial [Trebonia sp.]